MAFTDRASPVVCQFAVCKPGSEKRPLATLGEVHAAASNWRQVALGAEVGLQAAELSDFAPAFEHEQMSAAAALLKR